MGKEYAYARISRKTQKIERQIENLTKAYPDARIYQEAYTGTKTEGRKEFNKMLSVIKPGYTIVFDSVSRMSRNADDGLNCIWIYTIKVLIWYFSKSNILIHPSTENLSSRR